MAGAGGITNPTEGLGSELSYESIEAQIRALLPALRAAERRVGHQVLAMAGGDSDLAIQELAQRSDTSTTTVTRFCRAIGLSGFAQLKHRLAVEAGRRAGNLPSVGSDIVPGNDLAHVVAKLAFRSAQALQDTAAELNLDTLDTVIRRMKRAKRIDIYGMGASGLVGTDFQHKLHRIGRIAFAWSAPDLAKTSAGLLSEADVAFGISHSGETAETIAALDVARGRGATTVALTNFPRSTVALSVDHCLTTAVDEVNFRAAAMASRIAQLGVIDCLFVGLAQRTYKESRRALEATYTAVHGGVMDQ